jgi:hypothetical protein
MKLIVIALVFLCAPLHAADAQPVVIGTDAGAPTTREYMEWDLRLWQTFVAGGDQMTRLSFWFYGGENNAAGGNGDDQTTSLSVYAGANQNASVLYSQRLPQTHQGRFDVQFANPLAMVLGATYAFRIFTTSCGPALTWGGCGSEGMPIGDEYRLPSVDVTTVDAYSDGTYTRDVVVKPNSDLRFEAVFVPEPSTLVLLISGVAGLAITARRGRRT